VRTRSPSNWKGRGTQEGAGKREQVTLGEGDNAIQRGKEEMTKGEEKQPECDRVRQET